MLKLGLAVLLDLSEVGVFGKAKRIEVTDGRQGAWKTVAELGLLVVNIYWQNASTKHIMRLEKRKQKFLYMYEHKTKREKLPPRHTNAIK